MEATSDVDAGACEERTCQNSDIYSCPSNRFRDRSYWKPIYYGTPAIYQPIHYVPNRHVIGQYKYEGLSPLARLDRPAESIMIVENKTRWSDAGWWHVRDGLMASNVMVNFQTNQPASFSSGEGCFQAHAKLVNFAFADGHSKAIRPPRTLWPDDLWNCTNDPQPANKCTTSQRQDASNRSPAEYQ